MTRLVGVRGNPDARFWLRVARGAPDDCWPWTGYTLWNGYGQLMVDGVDTLAHRFAYERLIGPIPDGLQIDHLCRNRACCNPAHMEPVTHRENVLRGTGPTAQNARKTECKRGHAFTPDNTYWRYDGGRECIACRRMHGSPEARARRRAARDAA